jgi:protein SCO1/2
VSRHVQLLVALTLALCFALTTGCQRRERADEHRQHDEHVEHGTLAGESPRSDLSLYQLQDSWTDERGRPFELASLRGNPVVLILFYGTCESVCPTLVRDAQKLDALLPPADRARTRFALVTIDPNVDTPERLLAYAQERNLDLGRWSLLNGPPEQVRELANVLGFRYRPTGTGQYSHTIRITLLDRDGAVAYTADGLSRPLEPLATRISSLLAPGSAGQD